MLRLRAAADSNLERGPAGEWSSNQRSQRLLDMPSHAGMFTGRWAHEIGDTSPPAMDREVADDRGSDAGQRLRDLGVRRESYDHEKTRSGLGRGFNHYEDRIVSASEAVLSTGLGRAAAAQRLAAQYVRVSRVDQPQAGIQDQRGFSPMAGS